MAARHSALGAKLLAALSLALSACVQDDGRRFNPWRQMTEVTIEQEREIGHQFDAEVETQLTLIDDPIVLGFLADLGHDIVGHIGPQPFNYHFRVVLDPSLNAFAVPGGYIYFHSGTVLSAGTLDELAGVMGHEIAHVKGRHYAAMRKQAAIPDLLTTVGAVAAVLATGEPGAGIAAQGANVALQLKWSREYEADADRHGAIFMTRAGYDPAGITRFFERILHEQRQHPSRIPPYLYSHPDVEERIEAVRESAEQLQPVTLHPPRLDREFRAAQGRLALLVRTNRTTWPAPGATHREATDPLLERARQRAEQREDAAALALLAQAALLDPTDPEIAFRAAEIHARGENLDAAISAYRRTVELDPTRALVHYRLGLAYKRRGDRQRATFHLEQAQRRFGAGSARRRQAEQALETLIFPVLIDGGLTPPGTAGDSVGPSGYFQDEFRADAGRVIWWARLGPHFASSAPEVRVRWRDPGGALHQEDAPEERGRSVVAASLEIDGAAAAHPGRWEVEAWLGDEVIDRRAFTLLP